MEEPQATGSGAGVRTRRVDALPLPRVREVVAASSSWRQAARTLDLRAGRDVAALRQRCDLEGVAARHLAGPQADADLAAHVAAATSWPSLLLALGHAVGSGAGSGSARASVRGRARRLGLDLAHLEPAPEAVDDLVEALGRPRTEMLRTAGPTLVAAALLQRGCRVSWPLEPCAYDLLVELPQPARRVLRVQVKTGTARAGASWEAQVSRGGRGRRRVYGREDVDAFALVSGDGAVHLVPVEDVEGRTSLSTERYRRYRLLA